MTESEFIAPIQVLWDKFYKRFNPLFHCISLLRTRAQRRADFYKLKFLLPMANLELGYVVTLGSCLHVITGYAYMRRSYKEHQKGLRLRVP